MAASQKKKISFQDYALMFLLIVLVVIFAIASPNFLTIGNIVNILLQNAHVAVCCMAVAIIMISGGADLSIGNEIALASVASAILMLQFSCPIWLAIIVAIAICILCSIFNIFMTQTLKGNTMIITLATTMVYSGIAYTISNAKNFHNFSSSFIFIGQGKIFGSIPLNIIIAAIIFVLTWIGVSKTYLGKKLYAVGDNPEAARLAGINVRKVQIGAFGVAGILVGISCIMLTARAGNATATTGNGLEFTSITACVLGGIPLKGGAGKIWKVLIAAYILGILSNGMQLVGLGAYMQYIAKGAVMLLSIGMCNLNLAELIRSKKVKAV